MKDLHGLLFWLDNTKQSTMKKILSNRRPMCREKSKILREIEEVRQKQVNNTAPKFVK